MAAGGWLWWSVVALLGLATGMVGGLFGVGGGFVLVPCLHVALGLPIEVAVGTGMCQSVGIAVAAWRRHRRMCTGEDKLDWLMMGGSVLGVQGGAALVAMLTGMGAVTLAGRTVPVATLSISLGFVVVLVGVAAAFAKDARSRPTGIPLPVGPLTRIGLGFWTYLPRSRTRVSVPVVAYIGLALGFVSGVLGLGGGAIMNPLMLFGFGIRMRTAVGTGILMLLATAWTGTLAHALLGHVHLGVALVLLATSTATAPIGATLSQRVDGRALRGGYALVSIAVAVAVIVKLAFTA